MKEEANGVKGEMVGCAFLRDRKCGEALLRRVKV